MLGDITSVDSIYIVYGYTDIRKSIDGLYTIIQDTLNMDPSSNCLFLFCGKRRDRIKALMHESDGYVLLYKRLTGSGAYRWPRNRTEARNLTGKEFEWLMQGIEIDQPKAIKPEKIC